jgi:hypothetical protein
LSVALAALAGSALVYGSQWLLQHASAQEQVQQRAHRDAQAALSAARQEDEDFRRSAGRYQELLARGLVREENRLLLLEWIHALQKSERLLALTYDLSPQRPLKLANDPGLNAVTPMATRVTLRAHAAHEVDLLRFIDRMVRDVPGFMQLSECSLQPGAALAGPEPGAGSPLASGVVAECALEWVRVRERPRA